MLRRDVLRAAASGFLAPSIARRIPPLFAQGAPRSAGGMRPFCIGFSKRAIADLHRRLDAMRWPEMPFDTGWSQGTNERVLRDLVTYWRRGYDWFAVQSRLNSLTHLRGPIEGELTHCVVYQGQGARKPYPLLLMSGWPGSFLEFTHAAPLLAGQGYDLVVPSLPGYVFSEPARTLEMNTGRMADRMHLLMRKLGHTRYGIHGSDWGALIGTMQAAQYPDAVRGLHVTLAAAAPAPMRIAGGPASSPTQPRPDQRSRDNGWQPANSLQSSGPQTLGFALEDSPVGWLSWILMRYWSQSDHAPDADIWSVFEKDDILTTAMLYWMPGRVLSSLRLYWESFTNPSNPVALFRRITVPTSYARFLGSVPLGPTREAMEPAYNLVRYTEPPKGGHFAALEQPQAFATDVADFFASV